MPKAEMAKISNFEKKGLLKDVVVGADVFALSATGMLTKDGKDYGKGPCHIRHGQPDLK